MTRILVAVDGSEPSGRAARFAARQAARQGAVLELVHVFDTTTAEQLGMRALDRDQLRERGDLVARGSFEAAARAIDGIVPPDAVERHVSFGHPAEEITLRARQIDADSIVVGTRGLGPLRGALLGSVSQRVLALADRPVVVVP